MGRLDSRRELKSYPVDNEIKRNIHHKTTFVNRESFCCSESHIWLGKHHKLDICVDAVCPEKLISGKPLC